MGGMQVGHSSGSALGGGPSAREGGYAACAGRAAATAPVPPYRRQQRRAPHLQRDALDGQQRVGGGVAHHQPPVLVLAARVPATIFFIFRVAEAGGRVSQRRVGTACQRQRRCLQPPPTAAQEPSSRPALRPHRGASTGRSSPSSSRSSCTLRLTGSPARIPSASATCAGRHEGRGTRGGGGHRAPSVSPPPPPALPAGTTAPRHLAPATAQPLSRPPGTPH